MDVMSILLSCKKNPVDKLVLLFIVACINNWFQLNTAIAIIPFHVY